MSRSITQRLPGVDRYHDFYNNPADEIILRTGNILFRASGYRLSRISTFFQDMLAMPGIGTSSEIIDVDTPVSILELFLDHANASTSTKLRIEHPPDWVSIYDLARKFDCTDLLRRIPKALSGNDITPTWYWRILREASKKNDVEVGRMILAQMKRKHVIARKGALFWESVKEMDVAWGTDIVSGMWWIEEMVPKSGMAISAVAGMALPVQGRGLPTWIREFDPYKKEKGLAPRRLIRLERVSRELS